MDVVDDQALENDEMISLSLSGSAEDSTVVVVSLHQSQSNILIVDDDSECMYHKN